MIQVAVMGYGTIGSGVVEVLETNKDKITEKTGKEIAVKYILDLREFPGDPHEAQIVHDFEIIEKDEEVEIVVEAMGGVNPAYKFAKACLLAGKHVVTSNKALVAAHGTELLAIAREKNLNFLFEASVGGGIPLLRPLTQSLAVTRVFHVGSLSLTDDPSRTATYEAINIARNSGAVISYDPNYRAALWSDPETAQLRMQSLIPYVDMMKVSDEETSLLTPYQDPEEAIQYLLRQGVHLVAVTLGRDGALIGNENGIVKAEGFSSHAVDTTGAGDSFWGGFLASYLQEETSPEHLTRAQMIQFGRVGNAVASLCVERRGGISAIPEMEEIEERLRG